jgi:uncharacterized iron-regulated protein
MKKIAAFTIAAISISVSACASTAQTVSPDAGAAPPAVGPLKNIYETALIKSSTGEVRTVEQAADELSGYDVVFFGEFHGHPGNHLQQMRIFQALHERNPDMALSMEQFERDTQASVDQYLAGEIGEQAMQDDARGWDNYEQSYRPLVEYAKHNGLPVIASNAPKGIVICVGKHGPEILDQIPQPDRGWVAEELHLGEGAYWDKYLHFIASSFTHGAGGKDSDTGHQGEKATETEIPEEMLPMAKRSFSAQVTRDDTMAESIAKHLEQHPGRKVLHLDGNFHSASHLGTVERLKIRMPELKIAVINPIGVEDSNAPVWSEEDAATGDYILLIQNPPEPFVNEDRQLEFEREVIKKRMGNTCEYGKEPAE